MALFKLFDNSERKVNIGWTVRFGEGIVHSNSNKAREYCEKREIVSASFSTQCTQNRSPLMIEIEDIILIWLDDCNQKHISNDKLLEIEHQHVFEEEE